MKSGFPIGTRRREREEVEFGKLTWQPPSYPYICSMCNLSLQAKLLLNCSPLKKRAYMYRYYVFLVVLVLVGESLEPPGGCQLRFPTVSRGEDGSCFLTVSRILVSSEEVEPAEERLNGEVTPVGFRGRLHS